MIQRLRNVEGVAFDLARDEYVIVIALDPEEAQAIADTLGPGDRGADELMRWAREAREAQIIHDRWVES